ncbi:MAG: DEAD/DEAH box helicase [Ignavibacterium sp.]|nr:DEAD/DEAH box helicase [Ignavibacterium sp.]
MIQVDLHPTDEHVLVLSFKPIPYYLNRVKQILGAKYISAEKTWHIPKSCVEDVEEMFKGEIIWKTPKHVVKNEPAPPLPDYYKEIPKHKIPTTLPLYSFQEFGANFMVWNAINVGFSILADKMGSGKTPTSLGATELMRDLGYIKNKVLVICKKTLKTQWLKEGVLKFTNKTGIVIDGTKAQRKKQWKEAKTKDYIIINYEMLLNDYNEISQYDYDLIIVDEAHKVKSHTTKMNIALSQLAKEKQSYGFILTGTPIMNRPQELYGLFRIFAPDYLGKWTDFVKNYLVVTFNGRYQEQVGIKNIDELQEKTQRYMLRRTEKELGIELPSLTTHNKIIEPTVHQEKLHKIVYEYMAQEREKLSHTKTPQERLQIENKIQGYMQMLLAISDSLELLKMSDSSMAKKLLSHLTETKNTFYTPKIEQLLSDVEDIVESDEKVVIFTSFRRMAEFTKQKLEENGHKVLIIHGQISQEQRDMAKEKFWNDPNYSVLIGTDSMAEGLNLQCAKYLINLDLPWNPAIYGQRVGRIQRIGGHNQIFVYNYLSKDLFDETMWKIIKEKQAIIETFMNYTEEETKALRNI